MLQGDGDGNLHPCGTTIMNGTWIGEDCELFSSAAAVLKFSCTPLGLPIASIPLAR
jgi:hypothetical protein